MRLPAALAGLATAVVVYRAGCRWLGGWEGGLLAALVLLTSAGFVHPHVTRTGDFDALLTLWVTLGALSWLRYLTEGQNRHAWLAGLWFFLAAFTKGVAGLLFGPGLLVATLVLGQGQRLRRPAPWLAVLALLAGMATWYAAREHAEPGYLQAVWQYELGGPALSQLEGHHHEAYWYLTGLMESKFGLWLVPALLGALLGWRLPPASPLRGLVRFALCVVATFLLVLAFTQTKLLWYDAPMYPLLALLAAAGLVQAGRAVAVQQGWRPGPAARLGALALVVAFPYWAQCRALAGFYDKRDADPSLLYGKHLRQQASTSASWDEYYLGVNGAFNDSPLFYQSAVQMRYGLRSVAVPPWKIGETEAGRYVVVCGAATRRVWERTYRTSLVLQTDSCATLRLDARR